MVTVKQFLDAGFEFTPGDEVSTPMFPIKNRNEPAKQDDKAFVHYVAWRKNTGAQPVGDDCVVEIKYMNGMLDVTHACHKCWKKYDLNYAVESWRPHLQSIIEKPKMNENQEIKTALEMSERDIENYTDNCDVERELKESESAIEDSDSQELLNIGNIIHNIGCKYQNYENYSEILSSIASKLWDLSLDIRAIEEKQKAARERMESAYDLYLLANKAAGNGVVEGFDNWRKMSNDNMDKYWLAIVDKTGYRKQ